MTQFMREKLREALENNANVILCLKSGIEIEGPIIKLMDGGKEIVPADTVVIRVKDERRNRMYYYYIDASEIAACTD